MQEVNLFKRIVVLDTETTGINRKRDGSAVCFGHRVIEVGCVEIVKGKVTGRTFHVYVNPCRAIDQGAIKVHGITDSFVCDKPKFDVIAADFIAFIKGAVVVIHNAPFDISFLDQEFNLLDEQKQPSGVYKYIDTLALARDMFPGVKNDLDSLCCRFGIKGRDGVHGALKDAEVLAGVYSELVMLQHSR